MFVVKIQRAKQTGIQIVAKPSHIPDTTCFPASHTSERISLRYALCVGVCSCCFL